ncbi:hypothetical protein D3C80_1073770 [compost metagenome]
MPGLVQRQLVLGHLRRFAAYFFRDFKGAPLSLGRQAFDLGGEGIAIRFALALVGQKARVVEAQQGIALVDHLPFANKDFGDDTAFQVLDHLHLARRDRLAFAHGDFIQHREPGPGQGHQQQGGRQPDGDARQARRILQCCAGHVRHVVAFGGFAEALEVTAQALADGHDEIP